MADQQLAHRYLKKLLDSVEKAFPDVACFFVRENNQSLGIHFHIIFLFFGQQALHPEKMRQAFGTAVFERWNRIQGGSLARQANRMTLQKKDERCIRYLLKNIDPKGEGLARGTLWNGVRGRSS